MWDLIDTRARRIGRFAWVMAWVGLVVGQLHALSRFATADGREDLELPLVRAWAEPAAEWLGPLLDWGSADLVYVTYGKVWAPVFAAFTLMALVTYRRRRPAGFERWAWRVALTSYVGATVGVTLSYWTQWTGSYNGSGLEATLFTAAAFVTFPSLLLMLLSSTVLGVTLLVRGFRPALPAAMLALFIPFFIGVTQVTSLGSAALPAMFAFGLLGRSGRLPAQAAADRGDDGDAAADHHDVEHRSGGGHVAQHQ